MEDIILSIKPCFSNEIYRKNKTVELRKRIGTKFEPNSKIYIYSSYPEKRISGYAYIRKIQVLPVKKIRQWYLKDACISESEFDRYYSGHRNGILIWLHNVVEYKVGITLEQLKEKSFTAPQSFCYVSKSIRMLLEETT